MLAFVFVLESCFWSLAQTSRLHQPKDPASHLIFLALFLNYDWLTKYDGVYWNNSRGNLRSTGQCKQSPKTKEKHACYLPKLILIWDLTPQFLWKNSPWRAEDLFPESVGLSPGGMLVSPEALVKMPVCGSNPRRFWCHWSVEELSPWSVFGRKGRRPRMPSGAAAGTAAHPWAWSDGQQYYSFRWRMDTSPGNLGPK